MVSLRDIRNRIRSVQNVKQITSTMEMIASAALRKAQIKAKQSKPYITEMRQILEKVSVASTDVRHPLFQKRTVKKRGVVIVTSDRGLCGSYNANIFLKADEFLKTFRREDVELFLLGRKGLNHYRRRPWRIQHSLVDWSGKISLQQIKELTFLLEQSFLSEAVDEIWLIYTKFHSVADREVVIEKFLPIERPQGEEKDTSANYIFEPNIEEIFKELLPRYCVTRIQTMLYEAYASELAARALSMRAAAKNAEEMVESLTLERNKVRQAGITREMLEITAGAEAS